MKKIIKVLKMFWYVLKGFWQFMTIKNAHYIFVSVGIFQKKKDLKNYVAWFTQADIIDIETTATDTQTIDFVADTH